MHDTDANFMGLALRLARGGTGATYPNPCVGAVVVKNGRVVGSACSDRTGGPHAEVRALRAAGGEAEGATVYVTLEPCSHTGRTPPCTDALKAAGVREVVWGVDDPAPHASGRAVAQLQAAGISVRNGVMREHCAKAHEHYIFHETTGRPFVTLKSALSLDGRVACPTGDSRWITGIESRRYVHQMRAQHHAIAVGVGTVVHDNPQLTVRHVEGVDPIPVVFDSRLRMLELAKPPLLTPRALVLHTDAAPGALRTKLADLGGIGICCAADNGGQVSIDSALAELGARGIRSLMIEGGGQLTASFVASRRWQRWCLFHAPLVLGEGMPLLPGLSWPSVEQAPHFTVVGRETLGVDLLSIVEPVPTKT